MATWRGASRCRHRLRSATTIVGAVDGGAAPVHAEAAGLAVVVLEPAVEGDPADRGGDVEVAGGGRPGIRGLGRTHSWVSRPRASKVKWLSSFTHAAGAWSTPSAARRQATSPIEGRLCVPRVRCEEMRRMSAVSAAVENGVPNASRASASPMAIVAPRPRSGLAEGLGHRQQATRTRSPGMATRWCRSRNARWRRAFPWPAGRGWRWRPGCGGWPRRGDQARRLPTPRRRGRGRRRPGRRSRGRASPGRSR